eukprot:654336-Rhodomonas_salina.1
MLQALGFSISGSQAKFSGPGSEIERLTLESGGSLVEVLEDRLVADVGVRAGRSEAAPHVMSTRRGVAGAWQQYWTALAGGNTGLGIAGA